MIEVYNLQSELYDTNSLHISVPYKINELENLTQNKNNVNAR